MGVPRHVALPNVTARGLAASPGGDFDGLLALLDPDVVLRVDRFAAAGDTARLVRGARAVAGRARAYSDRSRFARAALVNGRPGLIVAPSGRLLLVQTFTVTNRKVVEIEVIADPDRLAGLELAILDSE